MSDIPPHAGQSRRAAGPGPLPAAALAALVLAAGLLGYGLTLAARVPPGSPAAWGVAALVAAAAAACAVPLGRRLGAASTRTAVAEALLHEAADRTERERRLRHDLRGVLSPALLTADRLLNHADPKVKRAGEIMVRAVERASELLTESASPPAGP
jgi:hypothetical protein